MKKTKAQEELEKLTETLKTEENEDRRQYEALVLEKPLKERKEEGIAWFPLEINEVNYGHSDRLVLELERTTDRNVPHLFQTGRVARLYTRKEPVEDHEWLAGVVSFARENTLKLTLFTEELPEWVERGKLALDLLFDETSYREMQNALELVINSRNNRLEKLREVMAGNWQTNEEQNPRTIKPERLNHSQQEAVEKILRLQNMALIHGPPGTGKTTTLVEAVRYTLEEEEQVMVCAPSNNAVDFLTRKFEEQGFEVLRIGNPARINEETLAHTLDQRRTEHDQYKLLKDLQKQVREYRQKAGKWKRKFGPEEKKEREQLYDEAKKLTKQARELDRFITNDLLDKADIITCTLVGAANPNLNNREFSTVFIDEATQATEPACWIPITKSYRVVMAGDHQQLPPTVKSLEAGKAGLYTTLFEKCIERQPQTATMLTVQYRMNQEIMNFSNQQFYDGKLEAHESVQNHTLEGPEEIRAPFRLIDTAGCGYEEIQEDSGKSLYNPQEATFLLEILNEQLKQVQGKDVSLGIISPYKAQVNYLASHLEQYNELANRQSCIAVNTVDGFQGQERDFIAISLVRSNSTQEIGFLKDYRRMNVAMTRARKKLMIMGDSATLAGDPFYAELLKFCEEKLYYKSAWEF